MNLSKREVPGKPCNYMTISSALRGLEKQGLLTHTTQGRRYVFRPVQSPAKVRQGLVQSLLERAFEGSLSNLLASRLGTEKVTPEDLAELKAVIAAKEQELKGEE